MPFLTLAREEQSDNVTERLGLLGWFQWFLAVMVSDHLPKS